MSEYNNMTHHNSHLLLPIAVKTAHVDNGAPVSDLTRGVISQTDRKGLLLKDYHLSPLWQE